VAEIGPWYATRYDADRMCPVQCTVYHNTTHQHDNPGGTYTDYHIILNSESGAFSAWLTPKRSSPTLHSGPDRRVKTKTDFKPKGWEDDG